MSLELDRNLADGVCVPDAHTSVLALDNAVEVLLGVLDAKVASEVGFSLAAHRVLQVACVVSVVHEVGVHGVQVMHE
jgi:hypothetical protein